MKSRKLILKNLFTGQQWRNRHREETYGHGERGLEVRYMERVTWKLTFSSVQFSHSVVLDSLQPHELQHTRPPCPSPTTGVHPNSCPPSRCCHPAISSSVVLFSCPQSSSIRVFPNESALHVRWPKYWSFSFSIIPSKENPRPISFRMDWLDLLSVQGTLKSLF